MTLPRQHKHPQPEIGTLTEITAPERSLFDTKIHGHKFVLQLIAGLPERRSQWQVSDGQRITPSALQTGGAAPPVRGRRCARCRRECLGSDKPRCAQVSLNQVYIQLDTTDKVRVRSGRDLMEELVVYIREAVDCKQENMRRRRRRDALRLQVVRVLEKIAENGTFGVR